VQLTSRLGGGANSNDKRNSSLLSSLVSEVGSQRFSFIVEMQSKTNSISRVAKNFEHTDFWLKQKYNVQAFYTVYRF
jgi:hypothetical protein